MPATSVRARLLLAIFATLLSGSTPAVALDFATSLASASDTANRDGKLILGEFGRSNCTECIQTLAMWETPAVRSWLLAGTALWSVDIDTSDEWKPFASGLGGVSLPLVAWIDASNPGSALYRKMGLVGPTAFTRDLTNMIFRCLPLFVTNLPGNGFTNQELTLSGLAQTNAALGGAVINVPIKNLLWRIEDNSCIGNGFQRISQTTVLSHQWLSWSQTVQVTSPGSVFASYVEYADGRTSWTNRVPLEYSGVLPPKPATIQILANGDLEIRGEPSRTAIIESSNDLSVWGPVQTNIMTGDAWVIRGLVKGPETQKFYRVSVH